MAALTDNEIKTRLLEYYTTIEANVSMPVDPSQVGISDKINIPDGVLQGINASLTNPHLYPQSTRGTRVSRFYSNLGQRNAPF